MHQEIPALVFGPGLPPGGAQGTVVVSALGIEIAVQSSSHRLGAGDIALREIGFDKPGLELAWRDGGETWAAHVLDAQAARTLLKSSVLANTVQAVALSRKQSKHGAARKVGWTVLALFVLSPVILLGLMVWQSNAIAGWITKKIPVSQEIAIGRQSFAEMRGQLKLHDEGPAYDAVKQIVARLTHGSKYPYEVHISDDPTLNAFAMPGGIVVVNSGLISATKHPEELAGVLAHEVQHVELRHSLRGIVKQLGLRGVWALVTGDVGSSIAGQAALELTALKFSRDDESEADRKGFDALVQANIDPSGMPAFFKTMSEQAADAPAEFLSTHPLSVDREAALQAKLAALNGRRFPPLAIAPWPPSL